MKGLININLLLIFIFIGSCSDNLFKNDVSSDEQKQGVTQRNSKFVQVKGELSRWDTPWWGMSDEQMADSLKATGGEVLISFKEDGKNIGINEEGRVLVSDQVKKTAINKITALGVKILDEAKLHPSVLAKIPIDLQLISALRNHPLIDIFEPNISGRWLQNEITWNIGRVNAPDAWSEATGSGAKLMIIDSGISNSHSDLNPSDIHACDQSNGIDQIGHGTHVSGIAAAIKNGQDVVGVSHGVDLWSVKVGSSGPTANAVRCAIEYGRNNDVHVINMSLGVTPLATLIDQINAAYNQDDIVLVAAAGNTSGGAVEFPANSNRVIAVTATDDNDNRWAGAAIGPEVELSAPGVDIESTCLGGGTCLATGTSMAAPHVAGAAALVKSYDPTCSNSQIRSILNYNAQPISGSPNEIGNGLLDAGAAVPLSPPRAEFEVIDGPGGPSSGSITVSYGQHSVVTNYYSGDPITVASRIASNINSDPNIQLEAETPSGGTVLLKEKRSGCQYIGNTVSLPNSPDNYLIPDQSSVILL